MLRYADTAWTLQLEDRATESHRPCLYARLNNRLKTAR